MPWPSGWWSSTKQEEEEKKKAGGDNNNLQAQLRDAISAVTSSSSGNSNDGAASTTTAAAATTLSAFTAPQTLIATAVLTTTCLGLFRFYKTYLRRIPEAANIRPSYFRSRSIVGKVTSVGDGDNFRIYHTPGGWLAGWGWLPWRRVPTDRKELKNQTVHIRIAGVDAPELSHFGRPSQPYAQDALDWLTSYLRGRRVRAYLHKADQYSRAVATVYVWKGLLRRDVGLQMLRAGLATVYEAKTGAEFGEGLEQKYRNAEWWAKTKRKGMWAGSRSDYESPREYKAKYGSGAPLDSSGSGSTKN